MAKPFEGMERFVELTHGKTRYFEKGTGEPVILLHGAGFSQGATTWYNQIEPFAEHFRVLAPDMLGWGVGDGVARHLAFPYFSAFVREFQDALGLKSTHIVGHSLGGWVAQIFAYESPNRVNKLVLLGAAGNHAHHIPPGLAKWEPPTKEQIIERNNALPFISEEDKAHLSELEWQVVSTPGAAERYRQMLEYMTFIEERELYQTPRLWPHITPETLVVSATEDAGYPPEVGREMAETMPNARQVVLEGGHYMINDNPKVTNDLVIEFLKG
jgi:pimeloyl-ACP methyl ester carboxylesterase